MRMDNLELLEYQQLKALLARYVSTSLGLSPLERLTPSQERLVVEPVLRITEECVAYLRASLQPQPAARGAAIRIRFSSIPEVGEAAAKLSMEGAVLEPLELLDLTRFLELASDARSLLAAVEERFPLLAEKASGIGEFRGLLKDVQGKILPDGTVADHASVALGRLRRDVERQQRQIQESLERFLRQHRDEGILQEDFITIRNERFVVPLIAGQRRKIDGVIHCASGSGHTLFVEPLETLELNNELVRLTEEERREIHRILREMTERLRGFAAGIQRSLEVMGELELLFAKAQFAVDFDCTIPRFGTRLVLEGARHPLLEDVLRKQKKSVVPLSLKLDPQQSTLLISGPNTGGKTVSLKTVGLLALMAQSGIPVPAAEAEFPMFDQVLADIGDNQSILESLSSFSAHIERVNRMLAKVTPNSLVLLDELGRATDPEEGGALGVAVLERFRQIGAYTLASTHLLAIKVYGANTGGVVNASMGFDDSTLEPTYVLRTGAPGKSAGLDIAARLGMPPVVVERAREAMSSSQRDIARFLSELQRKLDDVNELERQLKEQRAIITSEAVAAAREAAKREVEKLKEIDRRSSLLMRKFEDQVKETIQAITQAAGQRKAAEAALRKVAKVKRDFAHELETTVLETRNEARAGEIVKPKIVEGSRVRLRDLREPAQVRRKLADGRIEVQAGLLKLQVSAEEVLEVLPEAVEKGRLPSGVTFQQGPNWNTITRELNIIGKRAAEACEEVDGFLDTASLAGVDRVRIVHGHGMGVLKRAVAELLSRSPYVAKHYQASQQEGGSGATIVELKED
jgi:DNA mismatch repair protein MutS2